MSSNPGGKPILGQLCLTSEALTIGTGAVTVAQSLAIVDTESSESTDDLDTINGGGTNAVLILKAADAARTVVLKDGTGNLILAGDFSLDNAEDMIMLIYIGTSWHELCRSNNGA